MKTVHEMKIHKSKMKFLCTLHVKVSTYEHKLFVVSKMKYVK
jgi:hypothetical protein